MPKITSVNVFGFDIKLEEPFKISFKTFTHVRNLLIVIKTDDGIIGYGEAAPFKAITGDSRKDAIRFSYLAIGKLLGADPTNLKMIHEILEEVEKLTNIHSQTIKAAIDMACYDICGKMENKPVYKLLGAEKPNCIPNTLTIGIRSVQETVETAKRYLEIFREDGLKRIKLKLSGNPTKDYERVIAVAKFFDGELTLDANQAYTNPDIAVNVFRKLYEELGDRIILIEEPCPKGELDKMKYVKEKVEIPIFADESAATYRDAIKIAEHAAADGVNIKLQKAGGIYWGLKIAKVAHDYKLKLMVGCMLESGLSIAAGVHFASAIRDVINTDLDADLTLPRDIIDESSRMLFENGARIPRENPGLGVKLNPWVMDFVENNFFINKVW